MPRLKATENQLKDTAVREALARGQAGAGKSDEEMGLCIRTSRQTYQNKKRRPALFTLENLRRLDAVLKFTDEEIVAMVKGKKVR